jgi:hypothetical protein
LYELLRRIGPIDAEFGSALARVQVKEPRSGAQHEAQLAALEQATAGLGIKDKRSTAALPLYIVPPGQGAQWRPAPSIRRLIVHATDEQFDSPEGSPMKNGRLDFAHTIALMNEYHVQQIGLTVGSPDSEADLARVASGTTTLAPAGGADCGQGVVLKTGRPVVCVTEGDFSVMIGRLVRSLADRQSVILTARGPSAGMVRPFAAPNLRNIDVTVPNELPFRVAVSCEGQSVGRYLARLDATLREVTVASGRLTVDCVGPAAAVAAPPAPLAQPPAVAPAPPAPQPQGQPQAQPQPQPMTVAAMQQQEELQLALALQADEESIQTDEQLAMVGRRRPADHSVLVLLVAMTACTALGLSRLRSRPDPEVARAHVPR